MTLPLEKHQVPEILVHGDESALFDRGPAKDLRVSRIFAPILGLDDIVAFAAQPGRQRVTGAAVDQELHSQETLTASSESSAMTASA